MRVLIIGFPNSVHIERFTALLDRREVELHLFPSTDAPWLDELDDLTVHHVADTIAPPTGGTVRVVDHRGGGRLDAARRAEVAASVVRRVRPDLIHAHDIQAGGTLAASVRALLGPEMPPLILSNWGSDIYWFARKPAGRAEVIGALAAADALACESERDLGLASRLGYGGAVLPVAPVAGGLDLAECAALEHPGPVSGRPAIMVKCRESWAGRAGLTLSVLEGCADLLDGREIIAHTLTDGVEDRIRGLADRAGGRLTVLRGAPRREVLRAFGRSRVALAVSVADGIAQSVVEAMACGALPVQTGTATVREWFADGHGGLHIDPGNHAGMVRAMRRALTDDALVDGAREINRATVRRRADRWANGLRTMAAYRRIGGAVHAG